MDSISEIILISPCFKIIHELLHELYTVPSFVHRRGNTVWAAKHLLIVSDRIQAFPCWLKGKQSVCPDLRPGFMAMESVAKIAAYAARYPASVGNWEQLPALTAS